MTPKASVPATVIAAHLDSMTRAEAERAAAAVLRAIAGESFRRHRNAPPLRGKRHR